ncbi:unnamed protein product [Lactuca virosa]|uniref:Transposase MuDR plant domain-containing protein n=1 Tax=Lactuca virosa TaxID=75947 RepID=A0AAU9NUV4_9ASTR|nr:unnamed protein product [Lactuca virosa]
MYEDMKEVTIYVTTNSNHNSNNLSSSNHSNDDDDDGYSFSNSSLSWKAGTKFENVVDFRRALNHYAIINEFDYFILKSDQTRFTARCENVDCQWRIYASIMQDDITFEVRKIIEAHTSTRSNKGGNKRATQGWIANIIANKLKSDGDVSPGELRK